ncbi:hypothetical protein N0V85_005403 [Neurospora sp. IMI 360204]|nr:hypothetical protein N0V85_005403 [Neurospora sp. IMI 360204]
MSPRLRSTAGDQDASTNQVIIGIDFGTTFSGVAYTYSNKIDRMEIITSWDSELHSNSDEEKAPTAISYGPHNELVWGYAIPREDEQLKWFKLLLLDSGDLPEDVRDSDKLQEARNYLDKYNKTVEEAIAVMREAAKTAGILGKRIAGETQLTFVSEPEAAALATLEEMEDRFDVKVYYTYIGGLCGAVFVDEAFNDLLKSKFPKKKWNAMETTSRHRLIHDEWETGIKQQFDMNRLNRTWSIAMPWECMTDKERRGSVASMPKLEITGKEVKVVFDPVIEKITDLIRGQITSVKKKTGANPKVKASAPK